MQTNMQNSDPFVYCLVLNWNGPRETLACLASLQSQSYPNRRILVVDNGSEDDSVAQIQAAYPEVDLIENSKNLGFAAGINVGVRWILEKGADYILILNNDLVLDGGCLEELVEQAIAGVGLITAAIYFHDEADRLWSIGGNINPLNLEKTADARGIRDQGQFPRAIVRSFVPGGATMIAREVFDSIGLYDERYFLYYEDADYSLQANRAGIRMIVATQARMWHAVSASSGGSDSPRERYWMARSSVLYFRKNAYWWQWPIIFGWRSLSALRTSFRLLSQRRNDSLRAYWRGLVDGIRATDPAMTS